MVMFTPRTRLRNGDDAPITEAGIYKPQRFAVGAAALAMVLPLMMVLIDSPIATAATVTVQWNDDGDHTSAFRSAMSQAGVDGTILVPPTPNGQPWIVGDRLFLTRDGQTFRFAEGITVLSKAATPGLPMDEQPFWRLSSSLFHVRADRVSLIGEGSGATLKMRKDEFEDPSLYASSEWRHCVVINGAVDFLVENLTLRDSGGDGLMLTQSYQDGRMYSNGVIRNCTCDNNRRNGLSIVSTKSCVVEDCLFTNTIGTNPQAGVDVEPDDGEQFLEGVVLRRCRFIDNFRRSLMITSYSFHAPLGVDTFDKPFEVLVEDCEASGSMIQGIYLSGPKDVTSDGNGSFVSVAGPTAGGVTIRNTTCTDTLDSGLVFSAARVDSFPKTLENVTIENVAIAEGSPIEFRGFSRQGHGNITLQDNCKVVDDVDRPVIFADDLAQISGRDGPAISDVLGTLIVESPFLPRVEVGTDTFNTPLFENLIHDLGAGVNILSNPGFESELAGWKVLNNNAAAVPTRYRGQRGVRLGTENGGVRSDKFDVIPGATYMYSAQTIRYHVGNDEAYVGMRFFDSSGDRILGESVQVQSNGSWQLIGDLIVAPDSAVTADIFYWKPVGGVRHTFYGDEFSVFRIE